MANDGIRLDHEIIYDIIETGSKVLDLGCGDGELMNLLDRGKNTRVQGIEVDDRAVHQCVKKGLSVFQGDIESGLEEYPDSSFDYVILNQSLQEVRNAAFLLTEALRVGGKVIVGFPNFAYISARVSMFFRGIAPVTPSLPNRWYDTPNVRFLSINDFRNFCAERGLQVTAAYYLGAKKRISLWPNLFALNAVFVLAGSLENKRR